MIWTLIGIYAVLGAAWGYWFYGVVRDYLLDEGYDRIDIAGACFWVGLTWPYSVVVYLTNYVRARLEED